MSQDQEQRSGAGRHELKVGVADYRGHDCCAGAGWGGERGSWVSEVEAHGTGQGPQTQGVGAQAPVGQRKTWLPSCGGG